MTQNSMSVAKNIHSLMSVSNVVAETEQYMTSRIAPVKLDKDTLDSYQKAIFPTTAAQGVGGTRGMRDAIIEILSVSAPINGLLAFSRILLSRGSELEDMAPNEVNTYIQSVFKRVSNSLVGRDVQQIIDGAMEGMAGGKAHIIQKSSRYKGGYDVVFAGLPAVGGARIAPTENASIMIDPSNPNYENISDSEYKTELSLNVIEACKEIIKRLFGESYSVENLHKRTIVQLPLDFDFESLNGIFREKTGLDVNLTFKNISSKVRSANEYFSVVLTIDAFAETHSAWRKSLASKSTNVESNPKPDNSKLVSVEAMWCSPRVSAAFSLNLPKKVCQYICQSPEMKLIHYCLHLLILQWSKIYARPKGMRGEEKKGRGNLTRIPRYIVPTHKTAELKKARIDGGFHVDKGRTSVDGMSIDPRGRVIFLPRPGEDSMDIALDYEQAMDALLQKNYSVGAPLLDTITLNSNHLAIQNENLNVDGDVLSFKKEVEAFKGALLAFSWDYNTVLSTGANDGTSVAFQDLLGATPPDDLIIADMLGFDFKDEGERDQFKSFAQFFFENSHTTGKDTIASEALSAILSALVPSSQVRGNVSSSVFLSDKMIKLFDTYSYYAAKGLIPNIGTLVQETRREMGVNSTDDNRLDQNIYKTLLETNYGLKTGLVGMLNGQVRDGHIVLAMLMHAMYDSLGYTGSNLRSWLIEENGVENAETELQVHPNHFNPANPKTRLADFSNLYGYFGGRLFKNMCAAIRAVPTKELLYPKRSSTDTDNYLLPTFLSLSHDVMPMAIIFSKYVPNHVDYFAKAEKIYEGNLADTDIDVDSIIAPGVVAGAKVFPHQVQAHRFLRKRPKYAVLDIHPGGGKTATGILDILAVAHEHKGRFFPVVIAPDKLCKNWCEDTAMLTKGNWNCIPLTTVTFGEWGPERLADLIKNAPRNTILVAGINFLKSKPYNIAYGPRRMRVLGGVEFVKQFNPTYVLMDESHKAKRYNPEANNTSIIHKAVKEVFTMDGIEYARLATGTLVHGVLNDVVGQSAMFNAYIYKTPKTSGIDLTAADGPIRVRSKLGKYSSVITLKRKEWAFMLPNPIDVFIEINIDDGLSQGNILHAEVYQAVLKNTLDKMEETLKTIKSSGGGDSDDEDEGDGDGDDDSTPDMDLDDEDELSKLGAVGLQSYLQAVEQLVTDPWGEPLFVAAAAEAGIKKGDFMPAKIKAVVDRLDVHFNTQEYNPSNTDTRGRVVKWVKGMVTREYDVVAFEGKHYMRRAVPLAEGEIASLTRKETPPSMISPDKDTDNWKEEVRGKVIIFCRYVRVVDAIFDHLPPKYKNMARRFHGEVGQYGEDKWQNLDDFANDPSVQIFVANEQAIAEGHNLQMGSRIIRVDTPWSPGDFEQSQARIFRPDPKAAKVENGKAGDMSREVIYNDWIMTNSTTEVAKVARLMWKTVDKTKFDEKGNSRYEPINEIQLDRIPMSLKLLRDMNTMADFADYFKAKALLSTIERQEFTEMRRTTVAQMIDLPVPPIPADFEKMTQFPIMPNQRIPDTEGWGLERFNDWVVNSKDIASDLERHLNLLPVRTGFGTGVVVGFTINYITNDKGEKVPDPKHPVSSLMVRYKSNDELAKHRTDNVFVATKADPSTYEKFFSTDMPWSNETDRKRIEAAADKAAAKAEEKAQREAEKNRDLKKKVTKLKVTAERKETRRKNIREGKPVNEGIKRVKDLAVVKTPTTRRVKNMAVVEKTVGDRKLKIIPSIYNGFISIHATNNDSDAAALKKFEFVPYGEFLYVDFRTYKQYEAFLDWAEAKFTLDRATEKRLGDVTEVFEDVGRMGFNAKQALNVQGALQNFFRVKHKEAQDKKSIKFYPIVMHDRLRVVVDLATNPSASKFKGSAISNAGPGGTWKPHPGMHVFFAVTKAAAKKKLSDLTKAGFIITNSDKVLAAINTIK